SYSILRPYRSNPFPYTPLFRSRSPVVGPYTVSIGAAGAGGNGTSGGAGGATTFGTSPNVNCTANGGSGGLNMALGTTVTYQAGGAGGTVTTACVPGCKLQSTGGPGEYAVRASGSISVAGSGGNSHLGGGGYLAGTG